MSENNPKRYAFEVPKDATKDQMTEIARQHSGNPDFELPDGYYEQWQEANAKEDEKIARLREIAGKCGEQQGHSIKKQNEITEMVNFIYDIGYDAKLVACDERPDFVIDFNGEKIGVELTGMFDDEVVAEINTFKRKLDEATAILKATVPTLTGMFNFVIDPAKVVLKNVDLSKQLAACVEALQDGKVIPHVDGLINITRTPHKILQLAVSEEYILANIDIEKVKKTIQKKEDKFIVYKDNTGLKKFWLLIAFDGASAKGSFMIDINRLPSEVGTSYDKVFIYDTMKKTIISGENKPAEQ